MIDLSSQTVTRDRDSPQELTCFLDLRLVTL